VHADLVHAAGRQPAPHEGDVAPREVRLVHALESREALEAQVHGRHDPPPIVGDATYGRKSPGTGSNEVAAKFPRQALHAWRLSFEHPFTRQRVEVEAPLPVDVRELLTSCGMRLETS